MNQLYDTPSSWRDWHKSQEKHRLKINNIYSSSSVRIDNHLQDYLKKTPRMKPCTGSIYGSARNLREIDRKNQQILEKLTKMAKCPVVLKTLPIAENRVNKRKYFLKRIENERLHRENVMFAKRLAKTSSSVNFRKYEKEFNDNQRYLNIRKKVK